MTYPHPGLRPPRNLGGALLLSSIIVGGILGLPRPAQSEAPPWYDQDTCRAANMLVLKMDFSAAKRALLKLETSNNPDHKACALFNQVQLSEMMIARDEMTPAHIDRREFYLSQMIGFARQYGKDNQYYADMEMEAWTRRVRTYFDAGRRMDAVGAARTAYQMLEKRLKKGPRNVTVNFVSGSFDSAVGHASTPLRMLFNMAGIDGNITLGHRAVKTLTDGNTIYKYDAMYMAHHFSKQLDNSPFGKPTHWSGTLATKFPQNPQFVFDYGVGLKSEGRCRDTLNVLRPNLEAIDKNPKWWTHSLRAKFHWLAAGCHLDLREVPQAQARSKKYRAENFEQWEEHFDDMDDAIEDAAEN